jgi:hypothetical protein
VVTLLAIAVSVELLNHFVVEFWNHSIVDVWWEEKMGYLCFWCILWCDVTALNYLKDISIDGGK